MPFFTLYFHFFPECDARHNLDLFEEVSHCEYLANTQLILFLNKQDLFKEKDQHV